ncbi:uncharacterized protein [Anabrus simplex]|uniref:uncharacterized protein isoform X2 n=1 Tax=Anabrus simplex TaxID=316456 RepID=UPI0034DD4A81
MHVVGSAVVPQVDPQGPTSPSELQTNNAVTNTNPASNSTSENSLITAQSQVDDNGNGTPSLEVEEEDQVVAQEPSSNGNDESSINSAECSSYGDSLEGRVSLSADRTRLIRSKWLADAGPSHLNILSRTSAPGEKQTFRLQWCIREEVSSADKIALSFVVDGAHVVGDCWTRWWTVGC